MKWRTLLALAALVALSLATVPAFATDFVPPDENARCPVCGMFVSPYPNWASSVVLRDGTRVYFDGPKDLFQYVLDPGRFRPQTTIADIAAVFVTEYYTVAPVAAGDVFFIAGSDVLGPMGKELVPVAGADAARTFMRDHGGNRVLRFDGSGLVEVTLP